MFYSSNTGYTIAVFSLHVDHLILDSVVSASTGQTKSFWKYNFMNKHNLSGCECLTGDEYINPAYFTTGGVGGSDVCLI